MKTKTREDAHTTRSGAVDVTHDALHRAASREQIRAAFQARQPTKVVCELCEKDFRPTRRSQKFCSDFCRKTHWHLKREIEEEGRGSG